MRPMWSSVSRDGRRLLFNSPASGARNLWMMPVDGSAPSRQITAMPGDAVSHSSLSPDNTHVAFASIASGHSDIWTQNIDGSDLRQLTNDEPADSWPVWSPDGHWVAYLSSREGRAEAWRVRTSEDPPRSFLMDRRLGIGSVDRTVTGRGSSGEAWNSLTSSIMRLCGGSLFRAQAQPSHYRCSALTGAGSARPFGRLVITMRFEYSTQRPASRAWRSSFPSTSHSARVGRMAAIR